MKEKGKQIESTSLEDSLIVKKVRGRFGKSVIETTIFCFEVVYHLYSIPFKNRLRIKVRVREDETVPSVTSLWRSADFAERETFDMFGIVFEGHPNLKRIYMPMEWEGYPLRKDCPLTGFKDRYNPF